jgi:hypothetical protein
MTRDEAKLILHSYRPSDADANDPAFAKALDMTKSDPSLAAWFAEQQRFDQSMKRACANAEVPADLRGRILAKQHTQPAWWHRSLRPVEVAAAASFALLLAVGGFWFKTPRPKDFGSLRDRAIEESWNGPRHVNLETSNLAEIRRFIAAHDMRGDFKLPPELAAMRPRGCSLLHIDGRQTPFICFTDHAKHMHLVILDRSQYPAAPAGDTPKFDKWNNFSTATWSQGNTTFVLTGMRPMEFVKKFRKERQWTWGGG